MNGQPSKSIGGISDFHWALIYRQCKKPPKLTERNGYTMDRWGGWFDEPELESQKEETQASLDNSAKWEYWTRTNTLSKRHMMPLGLVFGVWTNNIRPGNQEACLCANGFATLAMFCLFRLFTHALDQIGATCGTITWKLLCKNTVRCISIFPIFFLIRALGQRSKISLEETTEYGVQPLGCISNDLLHYNYTNYSRPSLSFIANLPFGTYIQIRFFINFEAENKFGKNKARLSALT